MRSKQANVSGTDWVIDEGLRPGDKVIVEGQMRIAPGIPVTPKPYGGPRKAGG